MRTGSDRYDLSEFLFADRNKSYGAFLLRKLHDRNLLRGFLFATIIVTAGFTYPLLRQQYFQRHNSDEPIPVTYNRIIEYSELSAPPPIEAVTPAQPLPPDIQKKTVKFVKPVVKKDEDVLDEELVPTIDELKTTSTGYENIAGVDSISWEPQDQEVVPPPPTTREEPFAIVERMPEFPGGQQAMFEYIVQHIVYPATARGAEIQGVVYVQFVINKRGQVEEVEVLRGIGGGCDEEAIRVVQSMPAWQAGEQQGRKVPVKIVVPIRFTLL